MYLSSVFPTVVLRTITFPLDFEFEPPAEHLAIQDLLYQLLFFTSNDFRRRRDWRVSAGYWVGRTRGELDYIEYRM